MASFRDELRTVLSVEGLSAYLNALQQAQQGNLAMALQVDELRSRMTGIGRLLVRVGEGLGIQAGQWALIATAVYGARAAFHAVRETIEESMRLFERYDQVLYRTAFLFNSMGTPVGMSRLQGFARERAALTGVNEDETLALAARMRQTGFGPGSIGRLLPLLQDVQASGLTSATGALDMINRLLHQEGRGRGSLGAISELATTLRLDPRFFTGGQQHDLQEVIRQLSQSVGGLSERMSQLTVSGPFIRNQVLLHTAMQRLGGVIEASLVPAIEFMNRSLLGFTRLVDLLTDPQSRQGNLLRQVDESLKATQFNPANFLLQRLITGPLRALQEEGGTAAMAAREEMNRHLAQIEANTQNIASAIFLSVFGSASAFTRQAASFRNLQAAVNFRG